MSQASIFTFIVYPSAELGIFLCQVMVFTSLAEEISPSDQRSLHKATWARLGDVRATHRASR
ncbi:uncharacterized protein Z520_11733 [Fonsecaea multimorphosa CBS 102226]|uniref:Uncharacterized protein n=1 Tax=Fonsecaea multimorphosa CBS 102226 TaxID=1442371 RepID=A0A0D2JHA5_9EURO|nr:uncharacterized protein Z520_11733 [Fonsecaea multimorphosa CBS 102226]KIX92557.1 hypothetical protein Z520_11733 [Fonsecaea multimorphosa CBS 102226]